MMSFLACIFCTSLLVLNSMQQIGGSLRNHCPKNADFYPYFGTRTAYDVVRGEISRAERCCKPVQLWMLARHGTRYPSKSEIKKIFELVEIRNRIIENHKAGNGNLCWSILKKLKEWKLDADVKIESAKYLAPQGQRDMHSIAKRLQKAFPELLKSSPKQFGDFVFRATDTPRTQSSLTAFAEGLFGTSNVVVDKPPANDTLLLAYDNCPAWENRYWADHYDAESNKFAAGPEVKKFLSQVSQRLGFSQILDYETVRTMYNLCRFETSWHLDNPSIWCSLFNGDELKILEYQEDLDHYYYCGPGREWNAKLGCQPLKDMFTRFKNIVNGTTRNHPKGVFYFAHTVTMETLMAALEIDGGSSNPLKAANYHTSQNRKFRTSLLGPFATNVIAVLYKCTGSKTQYSVSFYTAEKLEMIKGCRAGLCDWNFIERKFGSRVRDCSMNFC